MFDVSRTLESFPRERAQNAPEGIATIFREAETSWSEVDGASNRVANGLLAAGIQKGDRVAILSKNSKWHYDVLFGAAKAGAVLVPINFRLAAPEISYILIDSGSRVLFVSENFYPLVADLLADLPNLIQVVITDAEPDYPGPRYEKWAGNFADHDTGISNDSEDTVVQLYTSGTTGRPKGALLSHGYFARALKMCLSPPETVHAVRPDEVGLVMMPLFHIGGLMGAYMHAAQGAGIIILEDYDPAEVLRLISSRPIPMVGGVPTMIQALLDHPLAEKTDFSKLRYLSYGAAPIPPSLLRRAMEVTGCKFVQFYGMTESTAVTGLFPSDHDPEGNEKMLSVGRALPGVELRIIDADGKTLPNGEVGEIAIRSPVMVQGYWNLPEDTAAAFVDGWFKSGDAGYMNADGYVFLKDRIKDMIISGGENIYPAEIEHALVTHPSVLQVSVVGVPDPKWGETPKAFIVTKPGERFDEADLRAHVAKLIARYKHPRYYQQIEALPMNSSGKILRRDLRQLHHDS